MPSLTQIRFRANSNFELKAIGDIEDGQRELFRELEADPEFHGLLVPKSPLRRNLLSVTRQTASLFRLLATPALLPRESVADEGSSDEIVDLVLDGIFEVEVDDAFVSGADALAFLFPLRGSCDSSPSLSRDALLHAQDLETSEHETLTAALYGYNRIPITDLWKTRFANLDAILRDLGAETGSSRALLEREWIMSRKSGFLSWSPKVRVRPSADDVTYKLYVSPRPERIRDVFEVAVRVLAGFPSTPFKIGDSASGLLRPDKFVMYFASRDQLDAVARELRRELAGCEPHGVPFTAAFDGDLLLSWGVDPPDSDRALRWLHRESWRLWVARRLAAAMSIAKSATTAGAVEPWRFALERARRHRVDVTTWTPLAGLWGAR